MKREYTVNICREMQKKLLGRQNENAEISHPGVSEKQKAIR